jgi:hypothetical protein
LWVPVLLMLAVALGEGARAAAQRPTSERERFHIFVLAGQSNMAGRGIVEAEDSLVHPRVWMLDRDLRWVPAVDPMHFDKPIAGVGPGRSFGIAMAEADPTIHIGLVPTAVGGSSIAAWVPGAIHEETGAYPYDEAIVRVIAAMKDGELKGVLWHQGESDSTNEAAPEYGANLRSLIERFRERLDSPDLPFLIGQLGRFERRPWSDSRTRVDAAQQALASQLANVAYVSAEGLTDMGDALHFSAAAARELGRRYAAVYRSRMSEVDGPHSEEPPRP